MRYSVQAGGKVPAHLCLESARIFSADVTPVLPVACALEFIHTYSLIHDDLPALDNATCGAASNLPQESVKQPRSWRAMPCDSGVRNAGGATIDRHGASRFFPMWRPRRAPSTAWWVDKSLPRSGGRAIEPAELEYIHRSKTAALIRASVVAGPSAAARTTKNIARLSASRNDRLAFQVVDDILDVEESSAALGKTAGKMSRKRRPLIRALWP